MFVTVAKIISWARLINYKVLSGSNIWKNPLKMYFVKQMKHK